MGSNLTLYKIPGSSWGELHSLPLYPGMSCRRQVQDRSSAQLKCKQPLQGDMLREGYLQTYFVYRLRHLALCAEMMVCSHGPGALAQSDGASFDRGPCHFSFPPDCLPHGISWSTLVPVSLSHLRARRDFHSRMEGLWHFVAGFRFGVQAARLAPRCAQIADADKMRR